MHLKVRERKKYHHWKKISPRTRKKIQGAKERYYRDPESRRQHWKTKYHENPEQQKEYEKKKYQENPKTKKEYEKKKYQENPEQKRECKKKKNNTVFSLTNDPRKLWGLALSRGRWFFQS